MQVEQFVMAYRIEQDRMRAMLPDGFESLRPVLRINTEIRSDGDGREVYIEFNTPVAHADKKGWFNIDNWSDRNIQIGCEKKGMTTVISTDFFKLSYTAAGITGGCPAEKDNDGCFFLKDREEFKPAEKITENKEFCDCEFSWHFKDGDASGKSERITLPAFLEEETKHYEKQELTAENAAAIPCQQVLGTYIVRFER